jgi:hypothetical protein
MHEYCVLEDYFGRCSKRLINAIQLDYKSINAHSAPVIFNILHLNYIYIVANLFSVNRPNLPCKCLLEE